MAKDGALLIGGAGYFGSRLAEALTPEQPVAVTYRSSPAARADWLASAGVQAIPFDSARDSKLAAAGSFGTVMNMAMPGAREAAADPEAAKDRALKTINATLALLASGHAERIIHFSTFHVYGSARTQDYDETTNLQPIHPYGETHAVVEETISAHPNSNQVIIFRPTNMVGAPAHADLGDQAGLIFLDLCRQASAGQMVLRNDGKSYRDILSFHDAIEAVRMAAATPSMGGGIFNLAAGQAMRLDALAAAIAHSAPKPVDITYGEGSDSYRSPFNVSVNRLQAAGWTPQNDLSSEIARTLSFFGDF